MYLMKVSWSPMSPLAPPFSWAAVVELELMRMVSSNSPFILSLIFSENQKL